MSDASNPPDVSHQEVDAYPSSSARAGAGKGSRAAAVYGGVEVPDLIEAIGTDAGVPFRYCEEPESLLGIDLSALRRSR